MTIPEPPRPDEPSEPDVPHPGPTDPRDPTNPHPATPPTEPPMPPLEPYDPSDPTAPHPGTRALLSRSARDDSPYDFGNLEALRQLRELFPGSRILFDLDARRGEDVITLESPSPLVLRTTAGATIAPRTAGRPAAQLR